MPEEAAAWLARALASTPYDIELILLTAEWTGRAGDSAGEIALIRKALELQPGRHDLERRLAIALLLAGEPYGLGLAQELLAEHPDDEYLLELLSPGPHQRRELLPPGILGMPEEDGHDDH